MKKYRVCQLQGCDIWRVEALARPVWILRWLLSPRWRVVMLPSFFLDSYRPAEYPTRERAEEMKARFEMWDREDTARKLSAWNCGV